MDFVKEELQNDGVPIVLVLILCICSQLVINEIDSSAATPLQAVKLLALYLSSPDNKESTISSLKEWLADPAIGNNPILRLIAGIIFMHEQDYNEALKHTNAGGTLELPNLFSIAPRLSYIVRLIAASKFRTKLKLTQKYYQRNFRSPAFAIVITVDRENSRDEYDRHALNVQIFLKMHRSDYAERQLRVMQQIDEDHTLTQLANAWLNLAVGGAKIQEAYLIFQDFSEKYQMTSLILNGRAVCCMHMGNFDEAETLLLEALNKAIICFISQDAKDPETLANLVVCCLHLGKPPSRFLRLVVFCHFSILSSIISIPLEVVAKVLISQLKLSHPDHILIKRATAAEESFDRAVQSVA
ncbi:hypothetical protein FEM48_Zijuj01G0109800 [Ziziphus jujuba var. spinosa]|uniref:Coatomer subunit epsilon-1-like n=1 Tax=Ziziphus jujuba var. spinosa TaxID=714518 RepID=A0A978W0V8_ZIZJJ|nr:hypothetical protein FEM48_Zijuj01G0109800 [Ziziphus jujuba var. spinosa]